MKTERNLAILLAGGSGVRFGGVEPKQFSLIQGKTILEHAIHRFDTHPAIQGIILVVHPDYLDRAREIVIKGGFKKVESVVAGGSTRQESSYIGVMSIHGPCKKVLIHDAVRPLVSAEIIEKLISGLNFHRVMVPVISFTDTVIQVDSENRLAGFPDRKTLKRVQTPQGFSYPLIRKAHRLARENQVVAAVDDCSLINRFDLAEVHFLEGSPQNLKITDAFDLELARILCKQFP